MRDAEVVDEESWLLSLSVDAKSAETTRNHSEINRGSLAVRVIAVCARSQRRRLGEQGRQRAQMCAR